MQQRLLKQGRDFGQSRDQRGVSLASLAHPLMVENNSFCIQKYYRLNGIAHFCLWWFLKFQTYVKCLSSDPLIEVEFGELVESRVVVSVGLLQSNGGRPSQRERLTPRAENYQSSVYVLATRKLLQKTVFCVR